MKTQLKARKLPWALAALAALLLVIGLLLQLVPSPQSSLGSAVGAWEPHGANASVDRSTLDPVPGLPPQLRSRVAADRELVPADKAKSSGAKANALTGRVVARAAGPEELTGSMRGHYYADGEWRSVEVMVVGGQFQFEAERAKPEVQPLPSVPFNLGQVRQVSGYTPGFKFDRARFDGDSFAFIGTSSSGFPSAQSRPFPHDIAELELHVARLPSNVLSVIDAATRAPLRGVHVGIEDPLRAARGFSQPPTRIGYFVAENASSPVTLAEPPGFSKRNTVTCWVGREGYAWQRVRLDPWGGGERVVPLSRGGSVLLDVKGSWPDDGSVLIQFTHGDGKTPTFGVTREPHEGPRRIQGLHPGHYTVVAQYRRQTKARTDTRLRMSSITPLCTAEVTVMAGATSTLELTIPPQTKPRLVEASGVIIVPPGWVLDRPGEDVVASIRGLPPTDFDRQDLPLRENTRGRQEGSYAFDLGPVPAGQYAFELRPGLYRESFKVPERGTTNLRFEVPPPCEIRVRPVDGETGLPVQASELRWRTNRGDGRPPWTHRAPRKAAPDGSYLLQVAEGPITLRCDSSTYDTSIDDATAVQGLEVTMSMHTNIVGTIGLKHGDTRVPWPTAAALSVRPVEGDGELTSPGTPYRGLDLERSFSVSRPGRYIVDVPDVLGFRHQGPVEIEMQRGERNSVTIELVLD